jgi:hypothetical protein
MNSLGNLHETREVRCHIGQAAPNPIEPRGLDLIGGLSHGANMGLPQSLSPAALLLSPLRRIPARAILLVSSRAVGPILGIASIPIGLLLDGLSLPVVLLLLFGVPLFPVPCLVPVLLFPAISIGLLSGPAIPFLLAPFLGQILAHAGSANAALLVPFLSGVIPGRMQGLATGFRAGAGSSLFARRAGQALFMLFVKCPYFFVEFTVQGRAFFV